MTAEFERLCPTNLLDASELAVLGCELQRARDLAERLGCTATVERIDERERTRFAIELRIEQRDSNKPPLGVHTLSREFEDDGFETDGARYDSLHKRYVLVLSLGIAKKDESHAAVANHGASASSDDDETDASTSEPTRRSRRLRDQKPEFDARKLENVLRNEPTTARVLGLARAHRVPPNVKLHAPTAVTKRRAVSGPRKVIAKKPLKRARVTAQDKPSWLRWAASKVTLGLIGIDPTYAEERDAYERELASSYADYPDIFAPPVIL